MELKLGADLNEIEKVVIHVLIVINMTLNYFAFRTW